MVMAICNTLLMRVEIDPRETEREKREKREKRPRDGNDH
jgi:hypothetical protein